MKFTRLNSIISLTILTFGLWSCGSSTKEEGNNSDEFKQAEESLQEQVEEIVYNIPSPSEIPYLLEATGAEFNQSLINSNKKADQYSTVSDKAAMNLGVYSADIGYLSSYGKTQEAIDYLNTTKRLADNIGVVPYDVSILKQFESNIGNKDSLAKILNRSIQKTDEYLKDDSRTRLAALVLTGSFVEGLYISTGLIKSYPKNILPDDTRNLILTPLMRVILEQEKSVDELLKMLSTIDQSEPVATMVKDLNELKASYRALNIKEQIDQGRADLVLTDKHLADITATVEKIRKSITG